MSTAPSENQPHATDLPTPVGLPPQSDYERGLALFERELPELMKTHYGKCVAYCGERRFGPADTFEDLEEECRRVGLKPNQAMYRVVEPDNILDIAS